MSAQPCRRRRSAATGRRARAPACRLQSPSSSVSVWPSRAVPESDGRRVDRRVALHDRARRAVAGVAAGGVRAGHLDAHGVAGVGVGERVGRVGRAGDIRAVRAGRVAALPLVGVGHRLRAVPRAVVRGQRLAGRGRAGGGRRDDADRRRGRDRDGDRARRPRRRRRRWRR